MKCGAWPEAGGVRFRVWAPASDRVDVIVYGTAGNREPTIGNRESGTGNRGNGRADDGRQNAVHPLKSEGDGYVGGWVDGVAAGTRYRYQLNGDAVYADPASRFQPEGVHGPSEVVDSDAFTWHDRGWRGRPTDGLVIYELHVGTFTPEGTFAAAARRLDDIAELGANAVELMPVAEFSGGRNWGYDGVFPYAPSHGYGSPDDLRRLIDAAHSRGLAVILDVVYNHFGPEGNVLLALTGGAFFTDRHQTPWGDAIDFARRPVREFLIRNALHWLREYHFDGFRLDATHAIQDDGERHFLEELAERIHGAAGAERHVVVIAEDDRNLRDLAVPVAEGGMGLDAVWADDFHHQVRRLTAGDHEAYFADFAGTVDQLAATLERGWLYEGQHSALRNAPRGTPTRGLPPSAFVHCVQNHDQVGNRALGERLHHQIPRPVYRAVSSLLLLSPYTPLLFQGQEWAADNPFLYFTDHPEELGRLVTEGRREEFKGFAAFSDPETRECIPDPQAAETFERSKLSWKEREQQPHTGMLALYTALLRLRREHPAMTDRTRDGFAVEVLGEGALALRRTGSSGAALLLVVCMRGELRYSFADSPVTAPPAGTHWSFDLATEERRFGGDGAWGRLEADGTLHMPGPGAVVLPSPPDSMLVQPS